MALSVGTELAALLAGTTGPEAGPRRAPAAATVVPGTEAMPGFAELLAAATGPELTAPALPIAAPAPAPLSAPPATRQQNAIMPGMPWDALAAAAEETGALAATFQLPGQRMPTRDVAPDLPLADADSALPQEADIAEAAATPLPVPLPVVRAPIGDQAAAIGIPADAKNHEIAADAPPVIAKMGTAPPAASTDLTVSSPMRGEMEKPTPVPSAAPDELPLAEEAMPQLAPQPAVVATNASLVAPLKADLPRAGAAILSMAPPASRSTDAKRSESSAAPAARPHDAVPPARPEAILPVEDVVPAPLAQRRADAAIPVAESAAILSPPVVGDAESAPSPLPASPFPGAEMARPSDALRPAVATSAAPLALRPHQVAEAGQQIVLRASSAAADGVETVSVDLRPPELGRVELRLTFRDGTVQISMVAERAETFEALRHDRANLEQQMQQAGLQLGSGGLDLQHGRLTHREAGEQERRFSHAPEPGTEEGGDETLAATRPLSDSLIDLIA